MTVTACQGCSAVWFVLSCIFTTALALPVMVYSGQTVAEVEYGCYGELTYCKLYELENAKDARYIVDSLGVTMNPIPFGEMIQIIDKCRYFHENVSSADNATITADVSENGTVEVDVRWSPWSLRTGIFPGTKWCGMGDIAKTYEDVGIHVGMDRCCRAHDHCPKKLKAFRADFGLVNLSFYTKSHCECDEHFYNCLKSATNRMADILGNFYFNIFKAQCMKEQIPVVCTEIRPSSNGKKRCVRWKQMTERTRMMFVDPERKY